MHGPFPKTDGVAYSQGSTVDRPRRGPCASGRWAARLLHHREGTDRRRRKTTHEFEYEISDRGCAEMGSASARPIRIEKPRYTVNNAGICGRSTYSSVSTNLVISPESEKQGTTSSRARSRRARSRSARDITTSFEYANAPARQTTFHEMVIGSRHLWPPMIATSVCMPVWVRHRRDSGDLGGVTGCGRRIKYVRVWPTDRCRGVRRARAPRVAD